MDRISDSDSEDTGSIPVGATREDKLLLPAVCPFLFIALPAPGGITETACGASISLSLMAFVAWFISGKPVLSG